MARSILALVFISALVCGAVAASTGVSLRHCLTLEILFEFTSIRITIGAS